MQLECCDRDCRFGREAVARAGRATGDFFVPRMTKAGKLRPIEMGLDTWKPWRWAGQPGILGGRCRRANDGSEETC
jgi:hypothetical protein